jgi:hypothetical protein
VSVGGNPRGEELARGLLSLLPTPGQPSASLNAEPPGERRSAVWQRSSDPEAVGALLRTARQDPAYYVRSSAVWALRGHAQARPELIDQLHTETDPLVLSTLVEVLSPHVEAREALDEALPRLEACLLSDEQLLSSSRDTSITEQGRVARALACYPQTRALFAKWAREPDRDMYEKAAALISRANALEARERLDLYSRLLEHSQLRGLVGVLTLQTLQEGSALIYA